MSDIDIFWSVTATLLVIWHLYSWLSGRDARKRGERKEATEREVNTLYEKKILPLDGYSLDGAVALEKLCNLARRKEYGEIKFLIAVLIGTGYYMVFGMLCKSLEPSPTYDAILVLGWMYGYKIGKNVFRWVFTNNIVDDTQAYINWIQAGMTVDVLRYGKSRNLGMSLQEILEETYR